MSEKIDLSSYSIQQKWFDELAPNYFNVDDISMLRIGLFGYINDAMANSFEDSLHMQTILSKEIFPNKAVLPDSIYAYAALANFTDFYAKGAIAPMVVSIATKDILSYATKNNISGNLELLVSKNSEILIDDKIPFIFDYDIKIIARYSKNTYIFSAQYIMNTKNELSSVLTPFINTVTMDGNLYLRLDARQLKRNTVEYMVYSNDVAENLSYEFEFEGRLAAFNVYYKSNAYNGNYELINKHLINSVVENNNNKFCFYSMSSTNKVTISFSTHPSYFRPMFNSQLMIEYFTTLGEEGNFIYDGENNSFSLESVDESKDLSSIDAYANVMGNSTGGTNEPSLADIKQLVMREFSMRKNIITDIDLQNYFKDKMKNSEIYFCKKRDDVIKRMFTAFVLLRNESDEIIPTNTLDLIVYQDQFDNYSKNNPVLTLKAGTIFEGCQGMNIYEKVDTEYDWQTLIQKDSNLITPFPSKPQDRRTNYLYGSPYLIKINTKPLFMSYYLNSINEQIPLLYDSMDENSVEEFIIRNVEIKRNAIREDFYSIETYINTTVNLNNMFLTKVNSNGEIEIIDYDYNAKEHIKMYGIFEEDNNITGYIKFQPSKLEGNRVYFKSTLYTDDYIDENDCINIKQSVYATSNSIENLRANFSLSNDKVKLHLCVYYNGYDYATKYKFAKQIPGIDNFNLCNTYTTERNLQLFKNLNSVMNSTVSMRISENKKHPGYYFKLRKVPLIRYMYMRDEKNMDEIIKILDELKNTLTAVIPDMENNFTLDSKFYNTYGESKYFTIGRQKTALNMTSISVTLNIKLNKEVTVDLINEIKNYIVTFIETTNTEEKGFLYMSNLTRSLEQNFSEINYIEFVGFNDYDSSYQIIESTEINFSEMTQEQVINYVPEYLNINRHIVLDNGELIFEPRVFLNFI